MLSKGPSKKVAKEVSKKININQVSANLDNEDGKDAKLILSLSIDMDDGKTEKLLIFQNEDINEAIKSFALKHQLNQEQVNLIFNQITENISDKKKLIKDIENNQPKLEIQINEENLYLLNPQIENLKEMEGTKTLVENHKEENEGGNRSSSSISKIHSKRNNFPIINDNSKKIARDKGLYSVNVFELLSYQSAYKNKFPTKRNNNNINVQSVMKLPEQSKVPTQIKSVMNLSVDRGYSRNTYLYDIGMKSMKHKKEVSIKMEKEREENELSGYKFAPKINENYLTKKCALDLQDSLSSLSKNKNQGSIQPNDEIYSFKPDLSITSKKINNCLSMKDNLLGLKRFDKLYYDGKAKAANIEKLQNEVSVPNFMPSICILDENILKKKVEIEMTHHSRIALMKKKKKLENAINKTTNFIPEINHNYQVGDRSTNVNERLYEDAKEHKIKLKNSTMNDEKKYIQDQKITPNYRTNNLIYSKRNDEFVRIFTNIDSEKSGKINVTNIEDALQKDTHNKLLVLIKKELQKRNIEIDCSGFCQIANKLFIELTPDEKNDIIYKEKIRKNKLHEDNNSEDFKPQINEKSLKIINAKKREKRNLERNYRELIYKFEQRVKTLKSEKEKEILLNCTFKPHIIKIDKKQNDKQFLFEKK